MLVHLQSVFFKFGSPDDCLCDHSSPFESHQFKQFMNKHGVKIHYSDAYRVASSGLVECRNGTLVSALRKLCTTDPAFWYNKLEKAAFVINCNYGASIPLLSV